MKRYRRKATLEFVNGKYQPVILEDHILNEIIVRLWWAKIKVFRINCPAGGKVRPNEPGIPDLIGWVPSALMRPINVDALPLFIEVKRPKGAGHRGGVHRPAQIRFIEEAKADGCIAFFADSWEQCVQELEKYGIKVTYDVGGK